MKIDEYYNETTINERDRILFAKQILIFVFAFVIFVFAFVIFVLCSTYAAVYNLSCSNSDAFLKEIITSILDMTKIVVPSTITLVLGFYYGAKD